MDPLRLITAAAGFFTRGEAKEAGYGDRDVTRMVRHRIWVRIRRGAYVFADEWQQLDDVGRHRVRCSAVLRSLGDDVALSHISAVVAQGIDVWRHDLTRVHVTRLDGGAGRIEGDVVHHEGFCLDEDVIEIAGKRVMRPQRCVLEAASRGSDEAALCLLDSGLRAGGFGKEELQGTYELLQHWPFMRHLGPLVLLADGRSGSVGESRGRWLFRVGRLPAPDLQVSIARRDGTVAGTCDWAWAGRRLLGEFDGRIKYGRLLKRGQTAGDVIFAEKQREDELRELTGYQMIRLVWADYASPVTTLGRLRRALRIAS